MIGSRTRSRELALQVLFALDLREGEGQLRWDPTTLDDAEASREVKLFADELVQGVLADLPRLDKLIRASAENWDLERLACVDRNLLRLAVHELLSRDDIPPKVSINEAIELGKRFSGAQSGPFINGILDRVRTDLGIAVELTDEVGGSGDGGTLR